MTLRLAYNHWTIAGASSCDRERMISDCSLDHEYALEILDLAHGTIDRSYPLHSRERSICDDGTGEQGMVCSSSEIGDKLHHCATVPVRSCRSNSRFAKVVSLQGVSGTLHHRSSAGNRACVELRDNQRRLCLSINPVRKIYKCTGSLVDRFAQRCSRVEPPLLHGTLLIGMRPSMTLIIVPRIRCKAHGLTGLPDTLEHDVSLLETQRQSGKGRGGSLNSVYSVSRISDPHKSCDVPWRCLCERESVISQQARLYSSDKLVSTKQCYIHFQSGTLYDLI
jgi:hypothetical protein